MANFDLTKVGVFHRKEKASATPDPVQEVEEELDASELEDFEDSGPRIIKNRRPKENKFTQQRIAAWNPVYTPQTVLPIYFIIAFIFVIVGGCTLAISSRVDEIVIYYHECKNSAPSDGSWGSMDEKQYNYDFHKNKTFNTAPQWRFIDNVNDDSEERGTCEIRFIVPETIKKNVYVNYLLENFSPNHRRYVLSYSEDQLRGMEADYKKIHENTGINCKPLSRNEEGKLYYPCGLIANSMFNDSFPFQLTNVQDPTKNYSLTNKNTNWHSDRQRFKKTKYNYTEIAPPPYWVKKYPDGYNETNVPNIQEWPEFQNWMRPAAFDKFAKLIRRNDNESLEAGEYQIDIGLHWPVTEFNGKKGIYITHGSPIGGKNFFLGIVYLIGGCICAALALVFGVFWMFGGRKIGDQSELSWNKDKFSQF